MHTMPEPAADKLMKSL